MGRINDVNEERREYSKMRIEIGSLKENENDEDFKEEVEDFRIIRMKNGKNGRRNEEDGKRNSE